MIADILIAAFCIMFVVCFFIKKFSKDKRGDTKCANCGHRCSKNTAHKDLECDK